MPATQTQTEREDCVSASNPPEPSTIVRTAVGYMAAKQLFSASRVGLFRALSDSPKNDAELAAATGVSQRNARILADAMVSLGLLRRDAGSYSLTTETAYFLGADAALDLAPFLHFLATISVPHWLEFYDKTVDTGEPGKLNLDEAGWGQFMNGVQTYNSLHASMLTALFDYSPYRSLLDFGGLSPAFAIGALGQNPELAAKLVYAPTFIDSVKSAVLDAGLGERAEVTAGPTETTVPEGSHDLILLSHVIHRFDAAQNEVILTNVRKAAAADATLLLLDFFLDEDAEQRELDALHAGEYFVIDGTIVYPRKQVDGWLQTTGWQPTGMLELPGSPRVLIAKAV
jgi:hypothetical protein